jgi:hypothetical protein
VQVVDQRVLASDDPWVAVAVFPVRGGYCYWQN